VNAPPLASQVKIPVENHALRGILEIPDKARSIIVFAHGLDSHHLNPRNRLVARALFQRGFAILLPDLIDLATKNGKPLIPHDRHGILLTANHMISIIDWLATNPATRKLHIGLFGSRSGAAPAMIAAALRPARVHAVVSRGGRPDLAEDRLREVQAPTLLLVGSKDKSVIDHNRNAGAQMLRKPMIELIQGASHLFEEPGKLEQVASISYLWFHRTMSICG
jgi:dienelactone hydrolase